MLNFCLIHFILLRPKESEIEAIMKNVCNHILKQDILKDNYIFKSRIQTALQAFTYKYLDLEP